MVIKIIFKHEVKPSDKITPQQLVDLILKHRQIKDINEFLNPQSPLKISILDFGFKKEWGKTLKLLKEIKKKNQMIIVYTDYDADGITGGAILWETLYLLGFKTMPYVPNRKTEGYGFSIIGIDKVIKKFNPALIISVDHGITKVKEIEYAKKKGIKIIITDHHLKSDKTPKAEAIFHIPELSGSGVAYFFAKEIFTRLQKQSIGRTAAVKEERSDGKTTAVKLKENFETDYLALASIGTIADLVPLIGPSRSIAKLGLDAFSKVKRYGIRHILKEAGIENKKITPYEVGFIIAPRINAVGRLKDATDALRLLCTTNESRAKELAQYVGDKNRERQDLVKKSVEEAEINLKSQISNVKSIPKIIILVSQKWHEGIIGLIASKITEEFYRPTIVLTKTNGVYKGSARSIPPFHITNFLRSLKKYLIDVGGHAQAAGFTIEEKKLNDFVTAAQELSSKLIKDKELERKIEVDIKVPVSKVNLDLVKALEKLEPFGIANPRPTFLSEDVITNAQLFGKTNNHLKIWLTNVIPAPCLPAGRKAEIQSFELIAFNQGEKFKQLSRGEKINVVYSLEVDRWNERERLRGMIKFLSS